MTEHGHCAGNGNTTSAVAAALKQLALITRLEPVAATGIRREQDGWSVLVDVVELERIPDTTDVMATYRVDLDAATRLCGHERLRRFIRGSVDPAGDRQGWRCGPGASSA